MSCPCEQIAGKDIELSKVCLGNLWIFQDLEPAAIQALNQQALRRKLARNAVLFHRGDEAKEMVLIKGGTGQADQDP